jgi:hypothetical protein
LTRRTATVFSWSLFPQFVEIKSELLPALRHVAVVVPLLLLLLLLLQKKT